MKASIFVLLTAVSLASEEFCEWMSSQNIGQGMCSIHPSLCPHVWRSDNSFVYHCSDIVHTTVFCLFVPCFVRQDPSLTWRSLCRNGWLANESPGPACLHLLNTGIASYAAIPSGFKGLNSDSHDYKASTFPPEPSPHLMKHFFNQHNLRPKNFLTVSWDWTDRAIT